MVRLSLLLIILQLPLHLEAQDSIERLNRAIEIEADPEIKAMLLDSLSHIHYTNGNLEISIRTLKESNNLIRILNPEKHANNLLTIAGYYQELNDDQNALIYLRLYSLEMQKFSEGFFLDKFSELERLQELETTALEEQRDRAIEQSLEAENALQDLQVTYNRFQIITLGIFILVLAGGITFGIFLHRRKPASAKSKESNSDESNTIHRLEREIDELQNYLHTGKYIASQLENLDKGSDSMLKKTYPDLVFYNKPRIGSGSNFLWHHITPDHTILVVGQTNISGLNGSLISVLMKKILDHVIIEENIIAPSMVMTLVDQKLRQYTGNESELAYVGCGMGYLVIKRHSKEIEFSGAGIPMYYLNNGEVMLHKGNVTPLANSFAQEKFFDSDTVALSKNGYVCIATSGFTDQAGHSEEKRFGRKSFIKLLKSISGKRASDQYFIIDKVHMEWKGLKPQTDDIMVVLLPTNNL